MMGKVVFVAIVAINVVLPSVDAKDYMCGPFTAKDTKCDYTIMKGDKFTLDCTGANAKTIPTTLMSGTLAGAQVCYETKARTDIKASCTKEVTLESLKQKNLAVTASTTKITIMNTDFKEKTAMILAGSCYDNADPAAATKTGYFNVTVKSDAKSHHIRVVLAVTGMALLGLTAF